MLNRIPGVSEVLNKNENNGFNSERGFGSSGDQILIDGQRISGKGNSIEDTLSRTSAAQIAKIELIRGAASGLDVQSEGLVINITLIEGAKKSSTSWKLSSSYSEHSKVFPEFLVSHNNSIGKLDYTVSVERKGGNGYFGDEEIFFNANNVRTGEEVSDGRYHAKGFKLNTNLSYNFEDGSVLRLNGLYDPRKFGNQENKTITGDDPEDVKWVFFGERDEWEVGGDYSRDLGQVGKFKALFVINRVHFEGGFNRFFGLGSLEYQNSAEVEDEKSGENIYRASITKSLSTRQSIEFGGEAAINTFERQFQNHNREMLGAPSILDTDDDVTVEEKRYEVFANHSFNISPSLVLQSSLITEFSKITADSVFITKATSHRDTSFTYLKPRLNFRYDMTAKDQLRLTGEKKINQLQFYHFIAFFDRENEEIKLGNTEIRPEQVWEFTMAYEHRLDKDGGTLEAEVFYHRYKDYVTRVDFSEYENFSGEPVSADVFFALPPDTNLRDDVEFSSKAGNIDKATSYGVKLKSNIRMGFIGVPDAVIGLGYIYENTKSLDQFTGLIRKFPRKSDHTFNFNFRHDITDIGLSYGAEGKFRSDTITQDINYYWPWNPGKEFKLFAEYNIIDGIKLRAEASQNGRFNGTSTNYKYNDHIKFNDLKTKAVKNHHFAREFQISLQGTF
jgi:outer membrane receptor for ferrienterochelin and colicins